ncbi:hypothetical protein ACFCXF_40435 [Streptomyces virginiae]|uniref:hypothetical protein n=1 Tax=Streptomyces virginiae TaxID=1961 RepID=UPI0035D79EAB
MTGCAGLLTVGPSRASVLGDEPSSTTSYRSTGSSYGGWPPSRRRSSTTTHGWS